MIVWLGLDVCLTQLNLCKNCNFLILLFASFYLFIFITILQGVVKLDPANPLVLTLWQKLTGTMF